MNYLIEIEDHYMLMIQLEEHIIWRISLTFMVVNQALAFMVGGGDERNGIQ